MDLQGSESLQAYTYAVLAFPIPAAPSLGKERGYKRACVLLARALLLNRMQQVSTLPPWPPAHPSGHVLASGHRP